MKKILLTLLLLVASITSFSQEVDSVALDGNSYWSSKLHTEMASQQYEQAYATMDSIDFNTGISNIALLDVADCLVALQKYDECINFCKWYIDHHSDDSEFFPSLFDSSFGECYYFKEDYQTARSYLSKYIATADESEYYPGLYHIGLYAHALKYLHCYKEAEKMYERWLANVEKDEDLTLDNIYLSKIKKSCGYRLYEYAYNSFFQGDEAKGARLLQLAAQCGDDAAREDYAVLSRSATFNKEVKYKRNTLRDFEEIIQTYDFKSDSLKNIGNVNANYFWYLFQKNNIKYNELNNALNRKKRPGTLNKALSKLNGSRNLIDNDAALMRFYQSGAMERMIDSTICGSKTFFNEIRLYEAQQPNAAVTPFGQVYITDALVKLYHGDNDLMSSICAHEATHYLLQHSLMGLWNQEKKARNNKIWAEVASGLTAAAQVGATMYAAANGVQYDKEYYDNMVANVVATSNEIMYAFAKDTYYFQFKYGRSQEIEADLGAYRFCEATGIGGYAYIMALQLLGDSNEVVKASKDSDHPTTAYRVGLLKYLFKRNIQRAMLNKSEQ